MTNDELIQYIRDGIAEWTPTGQRYALAGEQVRQVYAAGHRDFHGADLRGANLSGANLSWADLRGANLSGANNITRYTDAAITTHEIFIVDGGVPMLKAGCEWLPLAEADALIEHEDVRDRAVAAALLAYLKARYLK